MEDKTKQSVISLLQGAGIDTNDPTALLEILCGYSQLLALSQRTAAAITKCSPRDFSEVHELASRMETGIIHGMAGSLAEALKVTGKTLNPDLFVQEAPEAKETHREPMDGFTKEPTSKPTKPVPDLRLIVTGNGAVH